MKTTLKGNISSLIIFVLGTAFGVTVAKNFFRKKYEKLAQDEIESVREIHRKRTVSGQQSEQTEEYDTEKITTSYTEILSREGYHSQFDESTRKELDIPYVIPPEEYGEKADYELISLTYYADGVLADDCDFVVEDAEETVGMDSLNHFGDYEDDSVFVRNDVKKCDYEILADLRKYADIVKDKPCLYTEEQ